MKENNGLQIGAPCFLGRPLIHLFSKKYGQLPRRRRGSVTVIHGGA